MSSSAQEISAPSTPGPEISSLRKADHVTIAPVQLSGGPVVTPNSCLSAGLTGLSPVGVAPLFRRPADVALRPNTLLSRGNPPLAIGPGMGYVRKRPNWAARQEGAWPTVRRADEHQV